MIYRNKKMITEKRKVLTAWLTDILADYTTYAFNVESFWLKRELKLWLLQLGEGRGKVLNRNTNTEKKQVRQAGLSYAYQMKGKRDPEISLQPHFIPSIFAFMIQLFRILWLNKGKVSYFDCFYSN